MTARYTNPLVPAARRRTWQPRALPVMRLRAGQVIADRYRVLGLRWRGMASSRYLALSTHGGGPVELTVLPGIGLCDSGVLDPLRSNQAHTPDVAVPLLRTGRSRQTCILVTPATSGQSLLEEPIPSDPLREIGVQLLAGLIQAHQHDLAGFHDLSPLSLSWDGESVRWRGFCMRWLMDLEIDCRGSSSRLRLLRPLHGLGAVRGDLYMVALTLLFASRGARSLGLDPMAALSKLDDIWLAGILLGALDGHWRDASAMRQALLAHR